MHIYNQLITYLHHYMCFLVIIVIICACACVLSLRHRAIRVPRACSAVLCYMHFRRMALSTRNNRTEGAGAVRTPCLSFLTRYSLVSLSPTASFPMAHTRSSAMSAAQS